MRVHSLRRPIAKLFTLTVCFATALGSCANSGGDVSQDGMGATHDAVADTVIEALDDALENETSNAQGPLGNPLDGALYAAAGGVLITPNAENHPCTVYLGGTSSDRKAEGIHTELEARALVLADDEVHAVIISVDLVGWLASDVDRVKARLAAEGFDPASVMVSSTHTHNSPDTLGIWGPDEFATGRCPDYASFLVDVISELVLELRGDLRPAALHLAETALHFPEAKFPNLIEDYRAPRVNNEHLNVLRLEALDGEPGAPGDTIATLVNWHVHPEAMIHSRLISADMSHWVRLGLEEAFGGTALYLSGTIGGLQTILDAAVPQYSEGGEPALAPDGATIFIEEDGETKTWSAGYVVAAAAIAALEHATLQSGDLRMDVARIEVPFENPMMILAFQLGLLPPTDTWVTDDPERCGSFGCAPLDLHHLRLGDFHLVTVPGELFPESSVGRPASSKDFGSDDGGDWGVFDYPAMVGYRSALPEGAVLFELGLTNHEIGYIVPSTDAHSNKHPGYYEEYFCVSLQAEEILRASMTKLLSND